MKISTTKLGIHFNYKYLFKDLDLEFNSGNSYAVLGPNGIGKSTLLKLLTGFMAPTDGKVHYSDGTNDIDAVSWYKFIGFAAPYMDLLEDLTLKESLDIHFTLKPLRPSFSVSHIISNLGFEGKEDQQLKFFSSGMKQKIKLAMALFSDLPIIFLDEPGTNLDQKAREWYLDRVKALADERLLIIATNEKDDVSFCNTIINLP
jgi:ABC-type multidrug transport system ATPase subunit